MATKQDAFFEKIKRVFRITRSVYAAAANGFPSRNLKLIGVTGTSGKSTTSAIIHHILEDNGYSAGLISTVGAKAGNKEIDTGFHVTTPDPMQLQSLFKFMVKRKMEYVVVEASSHALVQGRLGFTQFDYSVFTNIKRDHLDWHGTWENYAESKAILADRTKDTGKIIINREDKDMYEFMQKHIGDNFNEKTVTYSLNEPTGIEETVLGTRFKLGDHIYQISTLGLYNVENALAAINVCLLIGLSESQIANGLRTFLGVEGRMQIMHTDKFTVIVDFAHNTDSLARSLNTARNITRSRGKVINVFGSAGLRDIEKRYTMGKASGEYADVTIICAEDPRTESLEKINSQILEGAEKGGGVLVKRFANHDQYSKYKVDKSKIEKKSVFIFDEESIQNRYDAIEFAIKIASEDDVVIAEGKGHERSLCFGTKEYDFTDQDAVEKALVNLKLVS